MPAPQTRPSVTGLILAGGRGSRMGGRDKGLIPFAGRPVIEYLVERLSEQTDHLLISANRNLDSYRAYGFPVVSDADTDYPGPLGGILAGLEACGSDFLLTIPCDAPLLIPRYRERMFAALDSAHASMAIAHDGNRTQNVHLLLPRTAATGLKQFLASGQRKVQDWVDTLAPAAADFSDHPEQFWNINTPAELIQLEQHWLASHD